MVPRIGRGVLVRVLCRASVALLAGSISAVSLADTASREVVTKTWGRAVFNTHYDTSDLNGFLDFATYVSKENRAELNFNPRDTRFGFSAQATEGPWKVRCVGEVDFYGTNANNNLIPRMRLGFAEFAHDSGWMLRAGQDVVPIAAQFPRMIDFGVLSSGGNLWWRVPQLTLRKSMGDAQLMLGAMKHRLSTDQEVQEKMPWLMARVAYEGLPNKGLLAIGGGFRSVTIDSQDYSPFLIAGEAKVPLGEYVSVTAEVYAGAGVGREFLHYGFDYNPDHPGGKTEIFSTGGFVSVALNAGPKTTFNVGGGADQPRESDLEGFSVPYVSNQVLFGNVMYKLTANAGVGAEVLNLTTGVRGGGDLTGLRLTTSFWFIWS